jgi:hypothetical protein
MIMKSKYTEDDVQFALYNIKKGVLMRQASLKWGVPRTVLHDRIAGATSYKEAAQPQQRLALVQEQRLTDWVLV